MLNSTEKEKEIECKEEKGMNSAAKWTVYNLNLFNIVLNLKLFKN